MRVLENKGVIMIPRFEIGDSRHWGHRCPHQQVLSEHMVRDVLRDDGAAHLEVTPDVGIQVIPQKKLQGIGGIQNASSIRPHPLAYLVLDNNRFKPFRQIHCNC